MASEEYDVNFCYPIRELENDRVKLVPFVPAKHAEAFFAETHDAPALYTYLPFGPFPTAAALAEYLNTRSKADNGLLVYAVLDKTAGGALAGLAGLLNTVPAHLSTEVGMLLAAPRFQRTGLTSAAVALLMQYCFRLPSAGGLGMRRVQWQTHGANVPSATLAKLLGFVYEGTIRWQRVLSPGKLGNGSSERAGDPRPGAPGRNTVLLSACWDDWEGGLEEKICMPKWKMYVDV